MAISKDVMRGFLAHLSAGRTLIGPVDTGKVIEYRKASPNEILMDDRVSYKSIKEFYFPQVERMFTFSEGEVQDHDNPAGCAIFGGKPCDLEALRVMKAVFTTGKFADPFFERRFDANLLIGVGCIAKKPGCFCDQVEVDMAFSDFCDIMLEDSGEGYNVEYLSEKGRQALNEYPPTKDVACGNTRKADPPQADALALSPAITEAGFFEAIDWAKSTETCQGCGLCSFICPTCHCFDFRDSSENGTVHRYKCWDSCIYPKFTLHASGHNPRESRAARYRQRLLHKYRYVPDNFGLTACTGCGRCVRGCPVGMDIRQVVKQVMEVQP
ncbi:MAG: 4Fe-4S dicluster domain-containing protein [Oscillospiraceae bacterium]|nr:4Fe-4S dicluster domain-containing protein [Oscillospiraceae bacterium]